MQWLWFEDPDFLKATRLRLGFTQTSLAEQCHLKRSLIADIEAGRRGLTEDVRWPIWEALARAETKVKPERLLPLASLRHAGSGTETEAKELEVSK